jgi:uncharacterized protein (TIGR02302 family)
MNDSPNAASGPKRTIALSQVMWRTGLSITWERIVSALWPAVAAGLVLAALIASDLLPWLPGVLHLGIVLIVGFAALYFLARGLRRISFPSEAEIRARVERENSLAHRPIEAVEDRLADGVHDHASTLLWRLHQKRERERLRALKSGAPKPSLASSDKFAAVGAACVLLLAGFVIGEGPVGERLARAASPDFSNQSNRIPLNAELWITPPAYTRLAPIYLHKAEKQAERNGRAETVDAQDGPVRIPAGSRLLASVHGVLEAPVLDLGTEQVALVDAGSNSFTHEMDLTAGTRLRITDGEKQIADWPIEVVSDTAPEISYLKPPAGTKRNLLALEYEVSDDYGVVDAMATIRRPDDAEILEGSPREITYNLPLPGIGPTEGRSRHVNDLTAHPLAGLQVFVQLAVTDAADQTGETESFEMLLPERTFQQPAARMIIGARKQLTIKPTDRESVYEALNAISTRPMLYNGDLGIFLAMRSAAHRLRYAPENADGLASIQELLWTIALRIEDGELALAERRLAEAEKRLQEALDRDDVSDEEMQQLMNELAQAMQEYFKELSKRLQEMGPSDQPIDPNAQVLSSREMMEMMEQMRQLNEIGAKDAAKQMLSQLRDMLQQLRNQPLAGMRQQPGQNSEMQRRMGQMQEMMRRQQELMDQNFQNGQRNQSGQQNGERSQEDMKRGAGEQESLRRQLGEMMRQLGENGQIPDALGRAERAMRDAARQLGEGSSEDALQSQGEALNALREGARDMAEEMARQQQMGRRPGNGRGGRGEQQQLQGDGRDPLGRRYERDRGGEVDDGKTVIPDKADVQKARDILDELRRRSSDPNRPDIELDYIDRLLDSF